MKSLLPVFTLLLALNATAEGGAATSRVEYAGLFKNGLVLDLEEDRIFIEPATVAYI